MKLTPNVVAILSAIGEISIEEAIAAIEREPRVVVGCQCGRRIRGPALSRRFIEAVKLHPGPHYRLALSVDLHPNTLSKLMNGHLRASPNDPRVVAIGRLLGLSAEECFESAAS